MTAVTISASLVLLSLGYAVDSTGAAKLKNGVSLLHVDKTAALQNNGSSFVQPEDQNSETTSAENNTCLDNDNFLDANGQPCKVWMTGDCRNIEFWTNPNGIAVFTLEQMEDIHKNCPASCFLCDPPNGHVRPTLADRPWEDPNTDLLGGESFTRSFPYNQAKFHEIQQKYATGLAAGGVDAFDLSDRAFYPEVYYEGVYYPICGIDLNDEAAARACQDIERFTEFTPPAFTRNLGGFPFWWYLKERFTYGGRAVKTNKILEEDAMPVGACRKGESLDSCTGGNNAFGNLTAMDGRCKKGNPVGVQIVCYRQCRKFGQREFTEEHKQAALHNDLSYSGGELEKFSRLQVCSRFLDNTTAYYFAEHLLEVEIVPEFYQFVSLLNVMNEKCAANVLELICHSMFKECKEVDVSDPHTGEGSSILLPSLLCKDECERHKTMWDDCVANIQKDSAVKELFNSNMADMAEIMSDLHLVFTGAELPKGADGTRSPFTLIDCDAKAGGVSNEIPAEDVAASWILGRIPQTDFLFINWYSYNVHNWGMLGWAFPRFMSSDKLYPEVSSIYTGPDGVSHEVPCSSPAQGDGFETKCPDLFVKSILPESNKGCVYACPVNQFTLDEYTTMWTVFVTIGMCSFFLNMFMVCTWKLAGRYEFDAMPFQLKACVFFGLLYGFVETIPSLIRKYDLPCIHDTVEDVGNSALCYVNRAGQYILLGIMINLCTLTISIHRALVNATSHESNMPLNFLSITLPFLFMLIGYILDTDDDTTENYNLNVARHAFSCSMRFSNMRDEWLVLWLPFCISGAFTAIFSVLSWWKIGDIQRGLGMNRPGSNAPKSEGQIKLDGQRRRLLRIAAMVSACLLLNVGTALYVTSQQSAWTDYEDMKLDCLTKSKGTRNWNGYGFNEQHVVEGICELPEDHQCTAFVRSCWNLASGWECPLPKDDLATFQSSCIWDPARSQSHLVCNFDSVIELIPDGVMHEDWNTLVYDTADGAGWSPCDCSCSEILPDAVERPSPFVMTLSFAAQSIVASIVAINLGFREDNIELWKKFFRKAFRSNKTTDAATGDGFQFDSKAYDNPESSTD